MNPYVNMYVAINERGAIYGPFDSVLAAAEFAKLAFGSEHAWRVMNLIRPTTKHTSG